MRGVRIHDTCCKNVPSVTLTALPTIPDPGTSDIQSDVVLLNELLSEISPGLSSGSFQSVHVLELQDHLPEKALSAGNTFKVKLH
jgi:hypothetical protein